MKDCSLFWDVAEEVNGVYIIRSKKEQDEYVKEQMKRHEKRAFNHVKKLEQNKDVGRKSKLEASTTRYSFFTVAEGRTEIYDLEAGPLNENRIDGPALHSYTDYDLMDISLKIKKGSFYLLIGDEGSGKSSLLAALYGELKIDLIEKPTFYIQGNKFLIGSDPWLINGSLKENITMNEHYDYNRMDKALKYSLLKPVVDNSEEGLNMNVGSSISSLDPLFGLKVECARAIYSK